ncbi:UNVERIFIED_CONTAM: hypothetical protein GTU68_010344 [Idotea baltica]|nr:hypothetical protein [Idotea baltica]
MANKILIVDFGSQYTQLIARRVRELNVFSDIVSCYNIPEITDDVKGIILSGSPFSVNDAKAPKPQLDKFLGKLPVLGICYGAQLIADVYGGKVAPSNKREYGKAELQNVKNSHPLLSGINEDSEMWMSHADSVLELPQNAENLAKTASIPNAAFKLSGFEHPVMGIQFHPEVSNSVQGKTLIKNFVINICECQSNWTSEAYIDATIADIKAAVGTDKVEAKLITGAKWLGQGTIYPDVIESVSVHGPSAKIKSHHNVGGLPEEMGLQLVEPLRKLFKDEVRVVGNTLQIDKNIINRHPFPGPGLAVRILGDITAKKVKMLQAADAIFIELLKQSGWYDKTWQAGVVLLPLKTVGVMGDERTYENPVALRAVHSTDGMTAEWVQLPYELLAEISNRIINEVKGINRVVYDISTKPPATIEWE